LKNDNANSQSDGSGERLDLERFSYFLEAYDDEGTRETISIGGETFYLPPRTLPAFPDARRIAPREPRNIDHG
jgi:hypothetical protein